MFRLGRREFPGIKAVKQASAMAPFLVLMMGLIPRSGRLLTALTGIILILALVACAPAPTYTYTSPPTSAPKPLPAPGEIVSLDLWQVGRYDNRVRVGENATFFLEMSNSGNKIITNIRLFSVQPEGWTTDFKPSTIDSLSPKNSQTIELNVMPGDNASEGGYTITVIADANEIRKVLDIWLTVEAPEGYWLWVGGIILLLVVAGFIIVYRRFGRE